MNVFRGKLLSLNEDFPGRWYGRIELKDEHAHALAKSGEIICTSQIKSIDFEKGVIQTQNSIYIIQS